MKRFIKHIYVLILALLIIAVASSSIRITHNQKKSNTSLVSNQKDKKENKETISASQHLVALIPFIQFDLVKDLYLISIFKFPVEKKVFYFNNSELPFTIKYFKALFCFVISPNAP